MIIIAKKFVDIYFDYYLLSWIKHISEIKHNDMNMLGMVILLTAVVTLMAFISGVIHIAFIFSITYSLFNNMIKRVCYAPVNTYFDVTPTGVILNRFSKDIQTVETILPFSVRSQLMNYVAIVSSIVLSAYNVPWILLLVPFIFGACFYLLKKFSLTLRETTKMESISVSPILTHLSETISGASTIRAYDKTIGFEEKQHFLQDRNVAALLLKRGLKGWFYTRIMLILLVFMSFTYIYCIFAKGSMDPVLIGLMMVYLMDIQYTLISMFR